MLDEPYCEDDSYLPFEEYEEYKKECKCDPEECECLDWDDFVLEWIDRKEEDLMDDYEQEDYA